MIFPAFYEADAVEQLAINLFHGWGYNFYRLENQLRADDQLVRSKVGWLLGLARQSVETAESTYRRTRMPPPSRAQPRPDPEVVAGAQRLERLSGSIGAVAGRIAAQPVPENDRMTQRIRDEAATLGRLLQCDSRLAVIADTLRGALDGRDAAWLLDNASAIETTIAALDGTLHDRQAILFG